MDLISDFEFILSEAASALAFEDADNYCVEDVEYTEIQQEEPNQKLIASDEQK